MMRAWWLIAILACSRSEPESDYDAAARLKAEASKTADPARAEQLLRQAVARDPAQDSRRALATWLAGHDRALEAWAERPTSNRDADEEARATIAKAVLAQLGSRPLDDKTAQPWLEATLEAAEHGRACALLGIIDKLKDPHTRDPVMQRALEAQVKAMRVVLPDTQEGGERMAYAEGQQLGDSAESCHDIGEHRMAVEGRILAGDGASDGNTVARDHAFEYGFAQARLAAVLAPPASGDPDKWPPTGAKCAELLACCTGLDAEMGEHAGTMACRLLYAQRPDCVAALPKVAGFADSANIPVPAACRTDGK